LDFDSDPATFDGDFFGNEYTMHDLGQVTEPLTGEDAHDEDNTYWHAHNYDNDNSSDIEDGEGEDGLEDFDEDEVNAMYEHDWEPNREGESDEEVEVVNVEERLPGTHFEGTPIPETTQRFKIEDRLRHPPFVVQFPGPAGRPLADRNSENADIRYRRELGPGSSFWQPFVSQIDWEVGRWAKLRGPSSNAFNELLKIPGVRSFIYY
jgi:hypothetical protein